MLPDCGDTGKLQNWSWKWSMKVKLKGKLKSWIKNLILKYLLSEVWINLATTIADPKKRASRIILSHLLKKWSLKQIKVAIEKQSVRPASQTYPACPTTREIMPAEEANEITMKVSWDNQQGWGEQVYSGADWVEIMWQNVKYSNWIVLHITGRFSSSSLLYLRHHLLSIRIRICSCTQSQTPCFASLNIVIISKIVG